jgi:A/G-specific adenine glycosylase
VESLAAAPQQEVLKLWSGLGYYSRARNLHSAAKEIVAEHNGKFPRTLEAALQLRELGCTPRRRCSASRMTCRWRCLMATWRGCWHEFTPMRGDLRVPRTWRALTETAEQLLARKAASDWNQALMELGEVICTPKSPRCLVCPVVQSCRAFAEGISGEIPAPRKKRAPVAMTIAAVILLDSKDRTLLVRDPGAHDEVLFSRMWQFPAIQVSREAKPELEKYFGETFGLKKLTLEELPSARHGVTFRNITLLPFVARVAKLPAVPRSRILALKRLGSVPVSSATKKLAAAVVGASSKA